jgi:hypothetical protein
MLIKKGSPYSNYLGPELGWHYCKNLIAKVEAKSVSVESPPTTMFFRAVPPEKLKRAQT